MHEYPVMVAKPPVPTSTFARRLREARLRANLPQDRLGVLAGIDESSASARISRYESGVHEPPFSLVNKLAAVLQVPTAFFYCEDDEMAGFVLEASALSADSWEKLKEFLRRMRR